MNERNDVSKHLFSLHFSFYFTIRTLNRQLRPLCLGKNVLHAAETNAMAAIQKQRQVAGFAAARIRN